MEIWEEVYFDDEIELMREVYNEEGCIDTKKFKKRFWDNIEEVEDEKLREDLKRVLIKELERMKEEIAKQIMEELKRWWDKKKIEELNRKYEKFEKFVKRYLWL